MTPNIETLIERLEDSHDTLIDAGCAYEAKPVADAITAMRAVQWRPISEAPKDGTHVLLLIEDCVIEGWWSDRGWRTVQLPSHGCGCCGSTDDPPTHWMPLPTTPRVEGGIGR